MKKFLFCNIALFFAMCESMMTGGRSPMTKEEFVTDFVNDDVFKMYWEQFLQHHNFMLPGDQFEYICGDRQVCNHTSVKV